MNFDKYANIGVVRVKFDDGRKYYKFYFNFSKPFKDGADIVAKVDEQTYREWLKELYRTRHRYDFFTCFGQAYKPEVIADLFLVKFA